MGETDRKFELKPRHEWMFKCKTFGIVVSCYSPDDVEWTWCLYALIYDNHPLFNDPEAAVEQLPWHCGCTYEERFSQEPARGIRYEWQRKGEWLKVGADYAHLYDDHYKICPPSDGIPPGVMADARELFDVLTERATTARHTEGA